MDELLLEINPSNLSNVEDNYACFSVLMTKMFGWENENLNFLSILLVVSNIMDTFLDFRDLYIERIESRTIKFS